MSRDIQFKQQREAAANDAANVDVDAEHDPETARRASNAGLKREQAAVQRKAAGPAKGNVQDLAAQGVQGGGSALPHFEQIQRSFGAHDVSEIKAHTGGQASAASKAMGAEAYATGNSVAFAGQPDLHTAAHEAAHVVQQRQGVALKSNVGEAGDSYERNADEVADRVVAGKPAGDLLGSPQASSKAAPAAEAVQKKDAKHEEPKAVTPEDRAAAQKASSGDTRKALSASISLLAKHMHQAEQTFNKERNNVDPERPGANVDVAMLAIQRVFDETSRVKEMLSASGLSAQEKNYLFASMQQLAGARIHFEGRFQNFNSLVGPGVFEDKEAKFRTELKAIFDSTGDNMEMKNATSAEPGGEGSDKAMVGEAIKSHLTAAKDAVAATMVGNPDVQRIKMHIMAIHDLIPDGVVHALKQYKTEIKELTAAVHELLEAHPDQAGELKLSSGLLKEFGNLSK